jgi:selenocysteine-specific elongation factor
MASAGGATASAGDAMASAGGATASAGGAAADHADTAACGAGATGASAVEPPPLDASALALEARLRAAGAEPPLDSELDDGERAALPALRQAGCARRLGRTMHAHPDALEDVRERVVAQIEAHGSIALAELRDLLGTSRKFAQAHLEQLDADGVTRRDGDVRVLRRRRPAPET